MADALSPGSADGQVPPGSLAGAGPAGDGTAGDGGDPAGGPQAVQSWEKTRANLGEVLDALPELRRKASAREAGTRTAVMTLVMVASSDVEVEDFAASVRSLGAHHPCRVVIVRPDPDSTPAIDAKACLWQAQPPEAVGHPVFFEEIHLRVGGQAASHLASIVSPFVLGDLPAVMWFPWDLPDSSDPLLRLASAILVDTRDVGPNPSALAHSYRTLLELVNHCPVVDLSWVRLQPWRELLAGLFEPEHNRAFLPEVRLATVTGKPGPRHVLGGWLLAQLDLRAREVVLSDAKHVDITLKAQLGDETGTFQVHRDDSTRAVWATAETSGGTHHRQALPLPDDSLTAALSAAISNLRADRVWERALASAASLAS
ncbi:MAG TPA: glucose-6-phosphate dehydrogenase assembly protein OpcA [Acidimicrobiales bacterium]|nr:glucose-6-phosphate dehydrogenase assembly protein OpcA [Acidimicrobiales bacterium]